SESNPRVAVDPNGNAVGIWIEGGSSILSSSLPFGGSWSSPIPVGTGTAVAIGIDSSGTALAVWIDPSGAVLAARLTLGSNTWAPVITNLPTSGAVSSIQVAVDPQGYTVAIWQFNNGTNT